MKTAVKVFLIISIVAASLCIFFGVIFGISAIGMGGLMADEDFMGDVYYDDEFYGDEFYDDEFYGDEFYDDEFYGDEFYDDEFYDDYYSYGQMIAGGAATILLVVGIVMFIVYGAIGGVQLALSIVALRKLNRAQCSDDFSIGWRVVVLLFVNLIAGILLLCMKDKDFCDTKTEPAAESVANMSIAEELRQYKELLDAGAITQEEYDEIKRKILSRGRYS